MATYNEIIKRLRDFSTAYYPIKSFGNGDMSELVETFGLLDAEYPKMWADDIPNTTALGEETFKFRIYMVGQVATLKEKTDTTLGEDNTNEVKSNMRQCCLDLLSYLVQDKDFTEMSTDRNITLTSFVDKFNDKLTGWYFDLTIKQAFSFSKCIIPMDGIPAPVDPTCDPVTININAESYTSAPSGSTENIVVKDTDGTLVGTLIGGEWIVPKGGGGDVTVNFNGSELTTVPCGDTYNLSVINSADDEVGSDEETNVILVEGVFISNSDNSFSATPPAETSYTLPDVTNTDSDGIPTPTPAQTPFVCTPCVPTKSLDVNKTGADTSYRTNDDGQLKLGREVDFLNLDYTNPFGNSNRFTDDLGVQAYASDVVVDWSTFNGTNVLCYYRVEHGLGNFAFHCDNQPYTRNSINGWYITNAKQLINICNFSMSRNLLNYPPFNYVTGTDVDKRLYTSTMESTTIVYIMSTISPLIVSNLNAIQSSFLCRSYTLAELGL